MTMSTDPIGGDDDGGGASIARQLDQFLAAPSPLPCGGLRPPGLATPAQISFIEQLQDRIEELGGYEGGAWDGETPVEDLTIIDASVLIEELKAQRDELRQDRRGGWGR